MYRILSIFLLGLLSLNLAAQQRENFNMESIGNISYPEGHSDVWGFVAEDGTEYAILGTLDATAIISLADPTNPTEIAYIPGANSIWRDIKYYNNHVYVVADQGVDGLLSIDMSEAPDTVTWSFESPSFEIMGDIATMDRAHNLYADENGYLYIAGANINSGGMLIMDAFTNPDTPVIVGISDPRYSHDVFVRNDTMYSSDIQNGFFSVIDATDKTAPITLATQTTTSDFTHNAWSSHDGKFLFTTDERANGRVDAYDISDLDAIKRVDDWRPRSTLNRGVIPHNTHYLNGYLITSYYTDGVKITDANRPSNLVEVGSYDTWDGGDGGFNGCWGATPFLPSGLVLASDRATGLYVLEVQYARAAYLEGVVTDAQTTAPIFEAEFTMNGNPIDLVELTKVDGSYAVGQYETGMYSVTVTHPEYIPGSAMATIESGVVTILNIELEPKPIFTVSGKIIDGATAAGIPDAQVNYSVGTLNYNTISDDNGDYSLNVIQSNATASVGVWSYSQQLVENIEITGNLNQDFTLNQGYYDDFLLDLGWNVSGTAPRGIWIRAEPRGTQFQGFESNPDSDIDGDLGNEMYVTGNGTGGAGADDVDDGTAILTSPMMDLAQYEDPQIEYYAWFFNRGGNSDPNDTFKVFIHTVDSTVLIESFTEGIAGFSTRTVLKVRDFLIPTDGMWVSYETEDKVESGHLLECGVDVFFAGEGSGSTATSDLSKFIKIKTYPNPFSDRLAIDFNWPSEGENLQLDLLNENGVLIESQKITNGSNTIQFTQQLASGPYIIRLRDHERVLGVAQIIKH